MMENTLHDVIFILREDCIRGHPSFFFAQKEDMFSKKRFICIPY